MTRPTTPEGLIKRAICEYLSARGFLFWVQQAGKIPGRINRSKYLRNGVSDILGSFKGRLMAIEVKVPGNKPTQEQKDFLRDVNADGGLGFIAHSVEEVEKALK